MAAVHILMTTTVGPMTLELDTDSAPKTVENFLSYVASGHYDGTIFHRVIDNFMIQGGGFSTDMEQKSTQAPIENEANNGLKNARGTIAMARTQDPPLRDGTIFYQRLGKRFPEPHWRKYAGLGLRGIWQSHRR